MWSPDSSESQGEERHVHDVAVVDPILCGDDRAAAAQAPPSVPMIGETPAFPLLE